MAIVEVRKRGLLLKMKPEPLVSIIVNNYNYERFLTEAVDSALAQTYPSVEVIVVDDGSTDGSHTVIAGYADRIIPIFQPNGKQGAAFNNGFAKSKGDIVIFLDADDYLHPQAAERIVEVWQTDTAKVHYRLDVVDSSGQPKGFSLPQGGRPLDSGYLQESIFNEGGYCGVSTSGNALSRQVMEKIFPIPAEFNSTSDDYLSVLVPLYGKVVAIEEPLGAYRIHDSNQWALVELNSSRFRRFVAHDLQRCALLKEKGAALGYDVPDRLEIRAFGSVWSRLASLRLSPDEHPITTDNAFMLALWGIRALWLYSKESIKKRILFSLWFIWVSLMPIALAEPAIRWLFMPNQRPQPLKAVKNSLHNLLLLGAHKTPSTLSVSQPLRVLFISHAYVVGVNQGKLAAIAQHAEVGLLAPKTWQSKGWNRAIALETPYPSIKTYPGSILFSGRGGAYLYNPLRIWQVLHQFKPDILQAEVEVFSLCALEMALWSRVTKIPLVIFAWENMDRRLFLRQWIKKFVLKTAPLIIVGNSDGKQVLEKWNYQGCVEVMPQIGVDEQLFTPKVSQRNKPEINIGFLGRIVPEKGIDLLIKAASQLKQQDLNFKLVICGSGPSKPLLQQQAEQQGVADCLVWRDAVPHAQVPQEIENFDILVLPSRTVNSWKEQFGHVLIEAMAIGIPTVGSTCGEIPNVINHPELTFEEENTEELAAILSRLIREQEFRDAMGQYCFSRAHEHYTHERIAQRSVTLWEKVRLDGCKMEYQA